METIEKHLDKAYPIFRNWVTNAKVKYPELNFQISDIAIVKNNLENTIRKAISSLMHEEKTLQRMTPGYDYGYFCGFLQGNLNTAWHSEYIYKQTNSFKIFAAVSTLDSFLKIDDLLKIRLSDLYLEHYKSQINLEGIDHRIVIDVPKSIDFLDIKTSEDQILVALQSIKIELLKKMFDQEIPDFLTSVEEFFTVSEVDEILAKY